MSDRPATKLTIGNFHRTLVWLVSMSALGALVACNNSSSSSSAGPPAQIQETGDGSGQSTTVGMAFPSPFAAKVEDSKNNPVGGATVTFTAPPSGPSGTFKNGQATETDTTDPTTGIATSSTFTANSIQGQYTVTASVTGVSTSVSYTLVNSPASTITATQGSGQGAVINTGFVTPLEVEVTLNGAGLPGVSVTFAAPSSGASGQFQATATVTTNTSGVATAPPFIANGTAGVYTVTATTPTSPTPANFTLINVSAGSNPLAAGNYVFSLAGTDTTSGFYTLAGVFKLNSDGLITGGEQSFSDAGTSNIQPNEPIYNGAVATNSDGNLLISIPTNVAPGGNTFETLHAAMVSSSKAFLTEFDSFATASGELDLQTSTSALCPGVLSAPCGYAFFISGVDSVAEQLSIGGVIAVDGASGGISGSGSVFDASDRSSTGGDLLYFTQTFSSSTVTAPDSLGRVQFTLNLNSNLASSIILDGYIIDANHIRLIENRQLDNLKGITLGTAFAQTGTGAFNNDSIAGDSYVVALDGKDNKGVLQVVGLLTPSSTGASVSGTFNYNDLSGATQSPLQIDPTKSTFAVDGSGTGRVTLTISDDTVTLNLALYLTGDGNAVGITLDSTDTVAGFGYQQTGGPFSAGSLNGDYAFGATGAAVPTNSASENELDGVGTISANGSGTFPASASTDLNWIMNTGPVAGLSVSGSYSANSTGVFTGTMTGLDAASASTQDSFIYYLVNTTQFVAIETDNKQITLGLFEQAQ